MGENNLSFEAIRPFLLHEFKSEDQLLKAVGEVGKLFNFYRENIEQYRKDEKLVSAYCAYYLTTNYPKLFEVVSLLGERFNIEVFDRIVDVGTGPGTFLLALSELAGAHAKLEGVDNSELMLEQAGKILQGLRPGKKIELGLKAKSRQGDEKTLLLFTHSLNEMGAQKAAEYIETVDPDSILLVEPGTKESFAKALELRTWAVSKGYNVSYPCFSSAPCPLDLEQDWCHQFIQVTQADDVERMTQKLHRNRRLLPLVVQNFQKDEVKYGTGSRLIRVKRPTKHSLEWQLCESADGKNTVFDAEIPKRGMSKKEVKQNEDILAGVQLEYEVIKELEDKKRIKLL